MDSLPESLNNFLLDSAGLPPALALDSLLDSILDLLLDYLLDLLLNSLLDSLLDTLLDPLLKSLMDYQLSFHWTLCPWLSRQTAQLSSSKQVSSRLRLSPALLVLERIHLTFSFKSLQLTSR